MIVISVIANAIVIGVRGLAAIHRKFIVIVRDAVAVSISTGAGVVREVILFIINAITISVWIFLIVEPVAIKVTCSEWVVWKGISKIKHTVTIVVFIEDIWRAVGILVGLIGRVGGCKQRRWVMKSPPRFRA